MWMGFASLTVFAATVTRPSALRLHHGQRTRTIIAQYSFDQPNGNAQDQPGYPQVQFGYTQDQSGYAQPMYVQAISDFPSSQAGELGFQAGDVIQVTQQGEPGGWWEGWLHQQQGWFPADYCSAPYYAQQNQYQQPHQRASYGYHQDEVYDPRSTTQTYEMWLERAH